MEPDAPYRITAKSSFKEDLVLIHPDEQTFKRLFQTARYILERAPYVRAKPLDPEGRCWLRRFEAHKTTNGLDVPVMLVSYEIVKNPPEGVIALRHVRTPEDVEAGLHADVEPF